MLCLHLHCWLVPLPLTLSHWERKVTLLPAFLRTQGRVSQRDQQCCTSVLLPMLRSCASLEKDGRAAGHGHRPGHAPVLSEPVSPELPGAKL